MFTKKIVNYSLATLLLLNALNVFSEPTTIAISVTASGQLANGQYSSNAAVSAEGRFVVFQSDANNLVTGDTNGISDIFLRDTLTNTTQRISIHSSGAQANGISYEAVISADGRYIAFSSDATNLIYNDLTTSSDVFVHDRITRTTSLVSMNFSGIQANNTSYSPTISANGRYIAFVSAATNLDNIDTGVSRDIFLHNRMTGNTTRVSQEGRNYSSEKPSISADGRFIAYESRLANLVFNDTNDVIDIFLFDRNSNSTRRINMSTTGTQTTKNSIEPFISADGNTIVYSSYATNLISNDSNAVADIFIFKRLSNTTLLANKNYLNQQANAVSVSPSISANGRYISYASDATNLVSNDTNNFRDIFIYDQQNATSTRANLGAFSRAATAYSDGYNSALSAHGNSIVFDSMANNLVNNSDTNISDDIFIRNGLNSPSPIYRYINSFETTSWPEQWHSYGWSLDNTNRSHDQVSLRANPAADNESMIAKWQVSIANTGEISFDMKIDSELGADFFRFYIDDVLQAEYSGFIDWHEYHYPLAVGEYTLRFEYSKDASGYSGEDSAWIDHVQFSNDYLQQRQIAFIEHFYQEILARDSDPAGLSYWAGVIPSTSATQVAFAFFESAGFQNRALNNTEFVQVAYNAILRREPEEAGLNYWRGQLDKGVPRVFVLYPFLQSTAFANITEDIGLTAYSANDQGLFQARSFTRRFYFHILAREPEAKGLDYWSKNIYRKTFSASYVARAFFNSAGLANRNLDDSQFLDTASTTLFGHLFHPAGKAFWLEQLANGLARKSIIEWMLANAQFTALANSYNVVAR